MSHLHTLLGGLTSNFSTFFFFFGGVGGMRSARRGPLKGPASCSDRRSSWLTMIAFISPTPRVRPLPGGAGCTSRGARRDTHCTLRLINPPHSWALGTPPPRPRTPGGEGGEHQRPQKEGACGRARDEAGEGPPHLPSRGGCERPQPPAEGTDRYGQRRSRERAASTREPGRAGE